MKLELGSHKWEFDDFMHKIFPELYLWQCKKCKIVYQKTMVSDGYHDEWHHPAKNRYFKEGILSCEEILMDEALG